MGASQSVVITPEDFKNYLYGTAVVMLAPRLDAELTFKDCSQITDEDQHVLPLVLNSSQPSLAETIKAYSEYYGNGKEDAIDKYVAEHVLDSQEHLDLFMSQLFHLLRDRHGRATTYTPSMSAPAQLAQPTRAHVRPAGMQQGGCVPPAPPPSMRSARSARSTRTAQSVRTVQPPQIGAGAEAAVPGQSVRSSRSVRSVRRPVPVPETIPEAAAEETLAPAPVPAPASQRRVIHGHGRLMRAHGNVKTTIDAERAAYQAQQQFEPVASTSQNIARSFQPPTPEGDGDDIVDVYEEASTQEDVLLGFGPSTGITDEHEVVISDAAGMPVPTSDVVAALAPVDGHLGAEVEIEADDDEIAADRAD